MRELYGKFLTIPLRGTLYNSHAVTSDYLDYQLDMLTIQYAQQRFIYFNINL